MILNCLSIHLSQDSYFGGDFVPYAYARQGSSPLTSRPQTDLLLTRLSLALHREALERGRAEMEDPDHIDWVALRGAARAARQDGRAFLLEGQIAR